MDLASLSISFAGPSSWSDQVTQVLGALPAVLGALPAIIVTAVLLYVVIKLRNTLPAIVARLTDVEAFGLKLSLSSGQAMSAAVEMARKNPDWDGDASPADQQRALDRALSQRTLLDGAEILWVDDHPSNNRNESRMLRSFGTMITFACTTEESLAALRDAAVLKRPFDMIISDMRRDYPTPDPKAGLDMLPRLVEAGCHLSVVFYVGKLDPTAGVPPGAFGVTNRPDDLLNLVLDALARVRGS